MVSLRVPQQEIIVRQRLLVRVAKERDEVLGREEPKILVGVVVPVDDVVAMSKLGRAGPHRDHAPSPAFVRERNVKAGPIAVVPHEPIPVRRGEELAHRIAGRLGNVQ